MLERLRAMAGHPEEDHGEDDNRPEVEFKALRFVTAQLLLLATADVAIDRFSRAREETGPPYPHGSPGPERRALSLAAAWAPAVVAPLTGAAHLLHVLRPGPSTGRTARVLSTAAIGIGVVGLVDSFFEARRTNSPPALSPLALASAGLLALIVDREERDAGEVRARLERRASITERLVPRRRERIDRIVVHV